jgi:hypothetical protein
MNNKITSQDRVFAKIAHGKRTHVYSLNDNKTVAANAQN